MNVSGEFLGILVGFYKDCFKTALQQVAGPVTFSVKITGIGAVYMAHDFGKVATGSFQEKVVVIIHQAIDMNCRSVPFGCGFKIGEKLSSIPVVVKCVDLTLLLFCKCSSLPIQK